MRTLTSVMPKILLFLSLSISASAFASSSPAMSKNQDLTLECVISADGVKRGYSEKLYDDVFIAELRSGKGSISRLLSKRKHPGSVDYSQAETVRDCGFLQWGFSGIGEAETLKANCSGDGESGSLTVNASTLEGELWFFYPQLGYPERSNFWVTCAVAN